MHGLVGHDIGVHNALAAHLRPIERRRPAATAHGPGRVLKLPAVGAALDDETVLLQRIEERLRLRRRLGQRKVRRSLESPLAHASSRSRITDPVPMPVSQNENRTSPTWAVDSPRTCRVASIRWLMPCR